MDPEYDDGCPSIARARSVNLLERHNADLAFRFFHCTFPFQRERDAALKNVGNVFSGMPMFGQGHVGR